MHEQTHRHAAINGTELLGLDSKTVSIEMGKEADLILLAKSPLDNIMALQDEI
jgi:imidazolonepropionase-like amidohydrolase